MERGERSLMLVWVFCECSGMSDKRVFGVCDGNSLEGGVYASKSVCTREWPDATLELDDEIDSRFPK